MFTEYAVRKKRKRNKRCDWGRGVGWRTAFPIVAGSYPWPVVSQNLSSLVLQGIHTAHHYVVCLESTQCYMSVVSQWNWGKVCVNFFKDYIFFLRESKRASRGREGEADSPMDPRTPGSWHLNWLSYPGAPMGESLNISVNKWIFLTLGSKWFLSNNFCHSVTIFDNAI